MSTLLQAELPLPLSHRGKVRDTYDLGDSLLLIATDRISAFDFVLPCGIPDKGLVLNQMSAFWFGKTSQIMPNHLIKTVDSVNSLKPYVPVVDDSTRSLVGRAMVVRKAERVPVECVVRGYMSGSAWSEYKESGTISGTPFPGGLQESQELSHPVFTPTTKAETGHDEPLTREGLESLVGKATAQDLEQKSLAIYKYARDYARSRGIIIADTKFEYGFVDGTLILIDELLTPDSSRFWEIRKYATGRSQPSLDKQPVRDWLVSSGWNKQPPAPMLPAEIIEKTSEIYRTAYFRLVGENIRR